MHVVRRNGDLRVGLADRREQVREADGGFEANAVEIESRRAGDAAVQAAADVLAHPLAVVAALQRTTEALDVEPQRGGGGDQVLVFQPLLWCEEEVVQLPELALRGRRFGGFGRVEGVRVRRREREVAKDEAQPIAETFQ